MRTRPVSRSLPHCHNSDSWTLAVLAAMSMLTVSSPLAEVFSMPRITVISIPFTAYMFFQINGKINGYLSRFALAYILSFVPSTCVALAYGEVRLNSFAQFLLGLFSMAVAATYLLNWMLHPNPSAKQRSFYILFLFYILFTIVESALYEEIFDFRWRFYELDGGAIDFSVWLNREMAFYGGRPSGLYSEPSHFARFIGLMSIAFIAVSGRSKYSLWATGLFVLLTRSASFFFAFPAMFFETINWLRNGSRYNRASIELRLLTAALLSILLVGGVLYTQSDRIDAALGNRAVAAAGVTGDTSLNERIIIPAGYFVHGPKSVILGLGPTPQDELQSYTRSESRYIYNWKVSEDFRAAISASILVLAGMGYVGVFLFFCLLYRMLGRFGVFLGASFIFANGFSSGYHTTTSFIPSAILLSILIFQKMSVTQDVYGRNMSNNKSLISSAR